MLLGDGDPKCWWMVGITSIVGWWGSQVSVCVGDLLRARTEDVNDLHVAGWISRGHGEPRGRPSNANYADVIGPTPRPRVDTRAGCPLRGDRRPNVNSPGRPCEIGVAGVAVDHPRCLEHTAAAGLILRPLGLAQEVLEVDP